MATAREFTMVVRARGSQFGFVIGSPLHSMRRGPGPFPLAFLPCFLYNRLISEPENFDIFGGNPT
jgi:hypothetical protein